MPYSFAGHRPHVCSLMRSARVQFMASLCPMKSEKTESQGHCCFSHTQLMSSVARSAVHQNPKPSKPKTDKPDKMKLKPDHPKADLYDLIGPPDIKSNLPLMKFRIPVDETDVEKAYREKREEVLRWSHEYWAQHNTSFFKLKEEFSTKLLEEKAARGGEEEEPMLTAEEMSQFYKRFLDDNYQAHMQYNKEWYKKNVSLLWPAFKVFWTRQLKRMRS